METGINKHLLKCGYCGRTKSKTERNPFTERSLKQHEALRHRKWENPENWVGKRLKNCV